MSDVPLAPPAPVTAGLAPRSLPIAGTRFALARPPGSADALLLAQTAAAARNERRLLVVIAADALDAQRLVDEIPYFDPSLVVRPLPDWETLPYDTLSPHQDLVSERLETLYRLSQSSRPIDVLVVPATTALHRLAPTRYVAGHTFFFRQGDSIDVEQLRRQLVSGGYQHVTQVVAPGEFAVRGGLIDLFPMGSTLPYRLDLLDAQLETIRAFDPDSQRGLYPVPEVRLLPGREFPIDETARQAFRRRWRDRIEGDPSRSSVYKDVGNGIAPAGIEYYLPLFFDETATLFDYLPPDCPARAAWPDRSARCSASGPRPASAIASSRATRRARSCRRRALFLDAEAFFALRTKPRPPRAGRARCRARRHTLCAAAVARGRAARRRSGRAPASFRRGL